MQIAEHARSKAGAMVPLSTMTACPPGLTVDTLLDMLARALAPRIAERLGASKPRYADVKNNPFGSGRAFLDAARRGDFPTFTRARKVTALWVDVETAIEARRRPVQAKEDDTADERAMLEAAGVRLRGADIRRRPM